MIEAERTLDIDATAEQVWAVLGRFMNIDHFAPRITTVEALSDAETGVGAKRKCNFRDGSSVVEEVIDWQDGRSYRVKLTELGPMPLHEAVATLSVEPLDEGRSRLRMAMEYRPKYGPLGWLMGQTALRVGMTRIFSEVLRGLEYSTITGEPVGASIPELQASS